LSRPGVYRSALMADTFKVLVRRQSVTETRRGHRSHRGWPRRRVHAFDPRR